MKIEIDIHPRSYVKLNKEAHDGGLSDKEHASNLIEKLFPPFPQGVSSRALGINPRSLGTNPRNMDKRIS